MNEVRAILNIEHLSVSMGNKQILHDVNLSLGKNEILGIVGKSGSGKTTLLKIIMGLVDKQKYEITGNIYFNGIDLLHANEEILRQLCGKQISMVWQNAQASLCPVRTIGEQLCETVKAHYNLTQQEIYAQAEMLLSKIGFAKPKDILRAYPFELSGGMNQRVAIALAVLLKPQILIADEPTSALDVIVQKQVLDELLHLQHNLHNSIILVTHNLAVARYLKSRVLVLSEGKLCSQ